MNNLTKITTHLPYPVECKHQRREEQHGRWIYKYIKKHPSTFLQFLHCLYIFIYIIGPPGKKSRHHH